MFFFWSSLCMWAAADNKCYNVTMLNVTMLQCYNVTINVIFCDKLITIVTRPNLLMRQKLTTQKKKWISHNLFLSGNFWKPSKNFWKPSSKFGWFHKYQPDLKHSGDQKEKVCLKVPKLITKYPRQYTFYPEILLAPLICLFNFATR